MAEMAKPLILVYVEYHCDHCGSPVVPAKAIRDIGRDGKKLHQCPDCQAVYRLDADYPQQRYIDFIEWIKAGKEALGV